MQAKVVVIGSIVEIFDREFKETNTYCIVSSKKKEDELSFNSPLGQALMGKRIGDILTVKAEEEYEIEIVHIDNSNVKIDNVVSPIKQINKGSANALVRNLHKGYGGTAQVIYDNCCKRFSWDYSKRYLFGMQQILYAEAATPEKYSPWFLPHNNWTDTKGGNWFNKIQGDTIEEMWLEIDHRFYNDKSLRVTFAKNKSKEYVFLGVYKPIKEEIVAIKENIVKDGKIIKWIGEKVGIKSYQLVFDSYPQ